MNITCISCSNTKMMGDSSASTKVCGLIKDMINSENSDGNQSIEILPLMNYDLRPCDLCGLCADNSNCIYEDGFNELFKKINQSDLIFFVVPFYSAIPSKLVILFEKLNEILYASWIKNHDYTPPFRGIPVGIIGHGGMPQSDNVLNYYNQHLVSPVARTLKSLSFKVISMDKTFTNGIAFGLEDENCIKLDTSDSVFPEIAHNYDMIKDTIKPFIDQVMSEALKN